MVNYNNGKIYKIVSDSLGKCYIGSTTYKYLSKRFCNHKFEYKSYLNGKRHYYTSFEILKESDCRIELIETYPCENNYELQKRERYYIQNTKNCVNKNIPTRNIKEWYEQNKDKLKELHKQYYEQNKDKIKELNKQYKEDNKDKIKEVNKKYYEDNKDKLKELNKQYYQDNKDKIKEQKKQYYEDNKDKIKEHQKQYREQNKYKIKKYKKQKVKCDICNSFIRKDSLKRHHKSNKHLKNKELKEWRDNLQIE